MVYIRGHPLDYDDWAAAGNSGWSWKEVLPYFKKSEHNQVWRHSPYHGVGGEMSVEDHRRPNKLGQVLIDAAESLGFNYNPDFNSGWNQEGFGFRQVTQRDGRRESAATAFLNSARSRKNLTIITGALAHYVLLEQRRAVGVRLEIAGQIRELRASREIVVSAGVIGSPLLLLRSGIGPAEHLRRHGIAVEHNLKGVGQNYHDHNVATIDVSAPRCPSYGLSIGALPHLIWSPFDYLFFRRGLFASNLLEAGGFVRTNTALRRPNIQFAFMSARRGVAGKMGRGHGYGLSAILLHPRSRGQVALTSPDPGANPFIDVGSFRDQADLDELVVGAKLARKILSAPAFSSYHAFEERPGAQVKTDHQLGNYIKHNSSTAFHPVGTCKMGNTDCAVVDATLRVHGIAGLRVVDASIMPRIIGGNTNAPTIMIAEKAADMILGRPALPVDEYA